MKKVLILLETLTTTRASMVNFANLIQSPQLAPWFRFDNLMTLWMVKAANLEILQSKKVWEQKWNQRF